MMNISILCEKRVYKIFVFKVTPLLQLVFVCLFFQCLKKDWIIKLLEFLMQVCLFNALGGICT